MCYDMLCHAEKGTAKATSYRSSVSNCVHKYDYIASFVQRVGRYKGGSIANDVKTQSITIVHAAEACCHRRSLFADGSPLVNSVNRDETLPFRSLELSPLGPAPKSSQSTS